MILGIGTDIVEIERIRKILNNHPERFLKRVYTDREANYCLKRKDPAIHLAGLFAAKEAVVKSLGTGFTKNIGWNDVEIGHEASGKPIIQFAPHLHELIKSEIFHLSISHSHTNAVAFVVRTSQSTC